MQLLYKSGEFFYWISLQYNMFIVSAFDIHHHSNFVLPKFNKKTSIFKNYIVFGIKFEWIILCVLKKKKYSLLYMF